MRNNWQNFYAENRGHSPEIFPESCIIADNSQLLKL